MTLAIVHREGDIAVLDAVRERPAPFCPDSVVREFPELLESYGVSWVRGDRYGGEWPRERFWEAGISYEAAEQSKSHLYRTFLLTVNSGRVQLLGHQVLLAQLEGFSALSWPLQCSIRTAAFDRICTPGYRTDAENGAPDEQMTPKDQQMSQKRHLVSQKRPVAPKGSMPRFAESTHA